MYIQDKVEEYKAGPPLPRAVHRICLFLLSLRSSSPKVLHVVSEINPLRNFLDYACAWSFVSTIHSSVDGLMPFQGRG